MVKKLLSVDEFCEAYGVGRTRCYVLIASEAIVAVKIGESTRITVDSAEAWAKSLPRIKPKRARPNHVDGDQGDDGGD